MSRRRQLLRGGRKGVPQVANVGDIAYKASDGSIKVIAPDAWSSALGTPIGVVVIPSGFAPDNGKARIISLYWGSLSSTSATTATGIYWARASSDMTTLTNYNRIPTTNNADSTATGSNASGYLPSDKFDSATSYVDSTAKYYGSTPYIPSPYLGDKPNPAYYAPISGYNNAFADFGGKNNTDVLAVPGTVFDAAVAARKYKAAGAEEVEWYLPSMGELGYVMPRIGKIRTALTLASINASRLTDYSYWSSTENTSSDAYLINTSDGNVFHYPKYGTSYVRPFAQLDF